MPMAGMDYTFLDEKKRWLRARQGAALSLGAPLGWLFVRWAAGASPQNELSAEAGLYLYMFLGSLASFGIFGYVIGKHEELLTRESITDGLTGLRNAKYFHARLEEEYARAQRSRQPFSLMIIDLDFFKSINDRYGHPVGDQVLAGVGKVLQGALRQSETAARVGGEEFAVLLPGQSGEKALQTARRLQRLIGQMQIPLAGGGVAEVKASVGLYNPSNLGAEGPQALYAKADQALYEAKRQGRNRVVEFNSAS